jgi:hypothetical protein
LLAGLGAFRDFDGAARAFNCGHFDIAAERCARERNIDRAAQDTFAAESYRRAQAAAAAGRRSRSTISGAASSEARAAFLAERSPPPVIKRTGHFGFWQRSAPVESKEYILRWHAGHLFCDGSTIRCFRFGTRVIAALAP